MDIIKTNRELKATLEDAQKQAVAIRDAMEGTDPMDVVYIGLALEAVNARIGYHEQRKRKKSTEDE